MQTLDHTQLVTLRERLLAHPLYQYIETPDHVRTFMSHHVFAVWDFMSLLKRLQQLLTVTDVPWMPGKQAQFARFINEIVLGEETDEDGAGGYISHFDLYLQAMEEVGADAGPIKRYLHRLRAGEHPLDALQLEELPPTVREFVGHTMSLALHGQPHEVAAAFFYGREDIIPGMFTRLVTEVEAKGGQAGRLVYYLQRHIELDGDHHGPLAEQLLQHLCGEDLDKLEAARETAEKALANRIRLFDGVVDAIR